MGDKICIKEVGTNREYQADLTLRCARTPKDFDERYKSADVVRDEGSRVHMQEENLKFRLETFELREMKVGERIFAKAGSSPLGSSTWPVFVVTSGPTPEKKT